MQFWSISINFRLKIRRFPDDFGRRKIFYLLEKNPIPPSIVYVLFSDLFRHLKESISCSMTLRLKKISLVRIWLFCHCISFKLRFRRHNGNFVNSNCLQNVCALPTPSYSIVVLFSPWGNEFKVVKNNWKVVPMYLLLVVVRTKCMVYCKK